MKFTIYEIYSNQPGINQCYIGSTTRFTSRKSHHKKNTNNKRSKSYHRRLYRYIRDNGGWENFIIEPLEIIECETRGEGLIREQYFIDLFKPTLNRNRTISII